MAECKGCGQPMLPRGKKKKPGEYDHARGCPEDPTQSKEDKWPDFNIAFGSRDAGGAVGVQVAVKLTMFGEERIAYFRLDSFLSDSGLDIYLKRREKDGN